MLESTPMITKKKLLSESSLSSLIAPDRDLLLTQITITRGCDGAPDRTLTLSPQGLRDHFAALTMEHAREQPIEEATFERLARALQVELNEKLRFDICETIIGTTLLIVRGWHGPREILKVLKQLRHDALGTMARGKDDRFIQFVVDMIQGRNRRDRKAAARSDQTPHRGGERSDLARTAAGGGATQLLRKHRKHCA
jgi:hypothetical protein